MGSKIVSEFGEKYGEQGLDLGCLSLNGAGYALSFELTKIIYQYRKIRIRGHCIRA